MELDRIIENAQEEGYKIQRGNDNSTIKTRYGDIKVLLSEGTGQAQCNIGKKQIYLFKDNEKVVNDLIHERDHFQIFPYDFLTFGAVWGSALTYSIYEISKINTWDKTLLLGAMGLTIILTHAIKEGVNLIGDTIIYAREKLGINKD